MLTKEEMLHFLHKEVAPALGCTEPVCVALAAAAAANAAGGEIQKIEVHVNPNIYKNGMAAAIPGFDRIGLEHAAALGACIAHPQKELQIFEDITPEVFHKAHRLTESRRVKVDIDREKHAIYVLCEVETEQGTGTALIQDSHTHIVWIKKDGREVFRKTGEESVKSERQELDDLLKMSIREIRLLVESASEEELLFLLEGAEMNGIVADFGLQNACGVGISDSLQADMGTEYMGEGLMEQILLKVSSSIEGRLDGCPCSVMSSAGSGSKGLALTLPVSETARHLRVSRETFAKALAFGHLLNSYINAHIGKLSAMCTCSTAASTAASAAMTWLFGGTDEQIGWAIRNMSGAVTGMICDGGKVGCALKLVAASSAAFTCARMAIHHAVLRETDGICGRTPEECIANMGRIGAGMVDTDKEILHVMLQKKA